MSQPAPPVLAPHRPVLPWRMVAGGLLHFAIGGYVLIVPLLCLLLAPPHTSTPALAHLALEMSLWFLGGLAALGLVVVAAAALVDCAVRARRRRSAAIDRLSAPELSRLQVERAAAVQLDATLTPLLDRIAAARWNHADPRHQAIARDLEEVVQAGSTAVASASPERKPAIAATIAEALSRILAELDALHAETARADEAQVQLLSNYVAVRYPGADSPFAPK